MNTSSFLEAFGGDEKIRHCWLDSRVLESAYLGDELAGSDLNVEDFHALT
jgi:hypothetical protein